MLLGVRMLISEIVPAFKGDVYKRQIESGKMKLEIGSFSMKELADGIANLIEPQAQAKGISFKQELDIPEEWVRGDSHRLNQVLINLLGNAVKFTPERCV